MKNGRETYGWDIRQIALRYTFEALAEWIEKETDSVKKQKLLAALIMKDKAGFETGSNFHGKY